MDYKELSRELLDEWNLLMQVRVPSDVVALRLELDNVCKFAFKLDQEYAWGSDEESLISAYNALIPKLEHLRERIVFEVLKSTPQQNK